MLDKYQNAAELVIGNTGIRNICSVLDCKPSAIASTAPIEEGLTNSSYKVTVGEHAYVYRVPGAGTEKIIDRAAETFSQGVARDLGIDETFLYEDEDSGWKLSRFVEGCVPFDYHNRDHVSGAMALARKLHTCGISSSWTFDLSEKTTQIERLLDEKGYNFPAGYRELSSIAAQVSALVDQDNVPRVLCHNDFYEPNFLVIETETAPKLFLIDWEYSAMSDYASDLGTFICCSDYSIEEAEQVLHEYFGRTPTKSEKAHCLAYVALAAWYWYVWALYKESEGDPVGDWRELWRGYAETYGQLALESYKSIAKVA